MMKKLKCKICPSTEGLHEMNHPAGWTYILCEKHANIQEKGFSIDDVSIEDNQMNVDLTVAVKKYCTCVTAKNPSECVIHGSFDRVLGKLVRNVNTLKGN